MSRLARRPWLVLTVVALVGGALVGGVSYWGSGPGTPPAAAAQAAAPITAADYGLVTLVVHPPTGPARTWRVLRADTTPLIEHGLMGQPDLGGHHGMLFEFATPGMLSFWMKDTPLPLTIAFFSADGAMQQPTIDMAPCVNSTDCPRYNAPAPYLYALEVPQHHLAALGLVPGSRITVPGP